MTSPTVTNQCMEELEMKSGNLSVWEGGYRGGAQWLSKKNEVLIRPMRIGPLSGTVPANGGGCKEGGPPGWKGLISSSGLSWDKQKMGRE